MPTTAWTASLTWWNAMSWNVRPRNAALTICTVLTLAGCASTRQPLRTPVPRVALRRTIDSIVAQPQFRSAQLGILIVDPERADTLYSHNAGKLFIPASNQKLITGAVAVHALGADYRFSTTVSARGTISGNTLEGDLVVTGTGDPSMSDRMRGDAMTALRDMADSLSARGVRRVTGSLTNGPSIFPDATLGFGWAWDDLDFPYSAGVDALYLNEGFTRIVVSGGPAAGDMPSALTAPASTYPIVRMRATTVAAPALTALTVFHDSSNIGNVIVTGSVRAGAVDTLALAYRNQNAAFLTALQEALRERGVALDGGVRLQNPADAGIDTTGSSHAFEPAAIPLLSIVSPPLRDILAVFEKTSQNQIGEILFKTIGWRTRGVGSAESGRAAVTAQLLAWGAPPDGFVVRDGSGLSRHNAVTPETLARVLDAMRQHADFATFHEALPIAGVDGTIASRMRGTAAQGNLRAKTGTLDMVRSLSGYVTTADGHLLIVVLLANSWTVPVREVERAQDAIVINLAQLRLGVF
ncbi:MAG: D-alanyl-D-alanine carboxypeptidase [Gemmatimonadaceae bacterium]|nr:D-alanyl-D-alanine carboxypeptidase [Gemmatimonadaceae bacterium]